MAKSHQPNLAPNGRYRVIIGGRTFWLGKDKDLALKLTKALDFAWDHEQSTLQGKKIWSEKSITTAYNLVGLTPPASVSNLQPAAPPPPCPPQPSLAAASPPPLIQRPTFQPAFHPREITFYEALDLYVKMRLDKQFVTKTLRRAGEDSEEYAEAIKHHLPDMPLHSIDAHTQKQLTDILISRPPHRKTGEPISIVTARKWLQELGAAFEYFSHPDSRIGWIPPYPQWREKFSIKDKEAEAIATNSGDDEYGQVLPTFTVAELAILYKAATRLEKFYILGAVCLGWTAVEFATLKRNQIKERDGEMYITKKRSKTGVEMTFWVCPELAEMFRVAVNKTPPNPADLALMTRNRRGEPMPLVHNGTDTISQAVHRVLKRLNKYRTKVPNYPHSRLRKLAGQLIENISGNHSLAQMLLSHKKADVASTNYIGIGVNIGVGKSPLERLWDAQREVHKALQQYVLNPPQGKIAGEKTAA